MSTVILNYEKIINLTGEILIKNRIYDIPFSGKYRVTNFKREDGKVSVRLRNLESRGLSWYLIEDINKCIDKGINIEIPHKLIDLIQVNDSTRDSQGDIYYWPDRLAEDIRQEIDNEIIGRMREIAQLNTRTELTYDSSTMESSSPTYITDDNEVLWDINNDIANPTVASRIIELANNIRTESMNGTGNYLYMPNENYEQLVRYYTGSTDTSSE